MEDLINKPSTPLRDIGEPGPPTIVDIQDSYTVVEGEERCQRWGRVEGTERLKSNVATRRRNSRRHSLEGFEEWAKLVK